MLARVGHELGTAFSIVTVEYTSWHSTVDMFFFILLVLYFGLVLALAFIFEYSIPISAIVSGVACTTLFCFSSADQRAFTAAQLFEGVRRRRAKGSPKVERRKSAPQHRPGNYGVIVGPKLVMEAIEEGNVAFLQAWVADPNHNVDSRFDDGQTILHKAAFVGNVGIVRLFLKEGADSLSGDADMNTPLHLACLAGNALVVKILTERDSDPFAPNAFDETPMELAEKQGHRGCQVLMKRAMESRGAGIPSELTLRSRVSSDSSMFA